MKVFRKHFFALTIFAVFGAFLLLAPKSYSQAIVPTITINLDNTPDQFKPLWKDADTYIYRYLTNPPWHDNPFDYTVSMKVGIWIDLVNDSPIDRTFKTYILVSNGADVQFSDKRWLFPLPDLKSIQRGGPYQAMLAVIDFYTELVLAAEFDKWDPYGGELWYTKARAIATQGKFDTRYVSGWNERNELLNDLTSQGNKTYRLFRYYAFTGEYMTANNQKDAKVFVDSAFVLLPRLKADDRKQFLSTSSTILADAAYRLSNIEQLQTLVASDSAAAVVAKDRIDKLGKK